MAKIPVGTAKTIAEDVAKTISKNTGRAMKGIDDVIEHKEFTPLSSDKIKQGIKDEVTSHGSGSFAVDGLLGLLKKTPGVKKIVNDESVKTTLYKAQKGMHDADLKAGNAIAEKLGDKHPKLRSLFESKEKIHVGDSHVDGKDVPLYEEAKSHRLSTPLEKTKKVATPLLAGMAIGDIVEGGKQKSMAEGGDSGVMEQKKAHDYREQLIEKISKAIANPKPCEDNVTAILKEEPGYMHRAFGYGEEEIKKVAMELQEKTEYLRKAADGLKKAASLIREKDDELQKIAEECEQLKLQIAASKRSKKAIDLAEKMKKKGLIKQAEFDDKVDQIMDMDESAYDVLRQTVEKVATPKRKSNGLDKLAYVLGDGNFSETKKKTLAESLRE